MRALKTLLTRGELGEPVLGTIEMWAIPHWQSWLRDYGRLMLLNMSIHLLDCFRYLFAEPRSVYAACGATRARRSSTGTGLRCTY
jgi:predicted dehydrogenase